MPAKTDHDLIFDHASDARVAASVTLAGVAAMLIGASFSFGPRLANDVGISGQGGEAKSVRVIGAVSPQNDACDEQVWPNIDQRCLVRTTATVAAENAQEAQQKEDDKLTPLTATGDAVVGKAVTPEDAEIAARQAAPPRPHDTAQWQARSDDVALSAGDDRDFDDEQAPPQRRVHRHIRFPFHGHIGPFRF